MTGLTPSNAASAGVTARSRSRMTRRRPRPPVPSLLPWRRQLEPAATAAMGQRWHKGQWGWLAAVADKQRHS